jgi:nicotinamidase-related amidase
MQPTPRPSQDVQGHLMTALLCIDVINGFDFPGSEALVAAATQAGPRIRELQRRARAAGLPVIYVNDNFGQWRSDFRSTVEACSEARQPGHQVSRLLTPVETDYFVLKPRHSGFYCTALQLLLQSLQVRRLILVGFATNICVLFTANDAHMRGYDVLVASDCTASNTPELTNQALEQMRVVSGAVITPSEELELR